jgi:hypothetical protein
MFSSIYNGVAARVDRRSPADSAEGWAASYRFSIQVQILTDFARLGVL